MEKATFAAGCFWGIEHKFSEAEGVLKTQVGYSGGRTTDPTYEDVCSDETGHAEVVQVEYDPKLTSFEKLVSLFWQMHDPTTLNRQGPDIGSQYRSAIFYHNQEQKQIAEASKASLGANGKYKSPVVTQIVEAGVFYPAEEYHQQYLKKKGLPTCHI